MTQDTFIKILEIYQTSQAPVEVKAQAIEKLKMEFQEFNQSVKYKEILMDIINSSSELKFSELY